MALRKEVTCKNLKIFFKSLDDLVFVLDYKKRFILYHAPRGAVLFADPGEFMGVPYAKVLPRDVTRIIDANWNKVMAGKVANFEYSAKIRGKEMWFSAKMVRSGRDSELAGVIAVVRDITKLKEDERILEQNYADLKKLDKLKSSILRDVSHELKTPISLIGFASKIILEELDDPFMSKRRIRKYADISMRNAKLLDGYVDSIVSLSRLRSSVRTEKKIMDLGRVLDSVVKEMRPVAEAKGLALKGFFGKGCRVSANRMQMVVLFRNLIGNAIKFTERGGVRVVCSGSKDHIRVKVVDTGKGIRKKDQAVIFSSFSKLQNEAKGLGLGLSIAKKVVRLHDGHISVVSRYGQGSEFSVVLPRCSR